MSVSGHVPPLPTLMQRQHVFASHARLAAAMLEVGAGAGGLIGLVHVAARRPAPGLPRRRVVEEFVLVALRLRAAFPRLALAIPQGGAGSLGDGVKLHEPALALRARAHHHLHRVEPPVRRQAAGESHGQGFVAQQPRAVYHLPAPDQRPRVIGAMSRLKASR